MSYSIAEKKLMKKDKLLKNIIVSNTHLKHILIKSNLYHSLINIIISQFISTQAAKSISEKMMKHFGTEIFIPRHFYSLTIDEIKKLGLSTNKSKSVTEVTKLFIDSDLEVLIPDMTEEQVDTLLLSIYGIGPWSVQMFKLFTLGYPDIFSAKDAALRKAMENLDMVPIDSPESLYEEYSQQWAPYRSIASRHLWASLH